MKNNLTCYSCTLFILSSLLLLLIPTPVSASCTYETEIEPINKTAALKFKLVAVFAVLLAGGIGVGLPILGRKLELFRPENDMFFFIKAFAAGVILATGYIHILPDAFITLTSPCLNEIPWRKFPFAGFIAMMSSIATLMIDTIAHGIYENMHFNRSKLVNIDDEGGDVHVHTHATHGHSHGSSMLPDKTNPVDIVQQRIISQILEMGIVVHSVIIGISLGASQNPDTIKTLLAALSLELGLLSQEFIMTIAKMHL